MFRMFQTLPLAEFTAFETTDVEFAQAEVGKTYCRHELRLAPGAQHLRARLNRAPLSDLLINYIAYGAEVEVMAEGLDQHHVLLIPIRSILKLAYHDSEVTADPEKGAILPMNRQLAITMKEQHDAIHLRIPSMALERHLSVLLGESVTAPVEFAPSVDLTRIDIRRWLGLLDYAVYNLESGQKQKSVVSAVISREMRDVLLSSLLYLQPHNYSEKFTHAAMPSNKSVRRAEDYIRAHAHEAMTIEKLAGAAGVGTRALQIAFRRWHGMTPLDYVRKMRLERIRDDLLRIETHESIAQITARWGIVHSGYFSREYYRHFGEKPSVTARRGAKRLSGQHRDAH